MFSITQFLRIKCKSLLHKRNACMLLSFCIPTFYLDLDLVIFEDSKWGQFSKSNNYMKRMSKRRFLCIVNTLTEPALAEHHHCHHGHILTKRQFPLISKTFLQQLGLVIQTVKKRQSEFIAFHYNFISKCYTQ